LGVVSESAELGGLSPWIGVDPHPDLSAGGVLVGEPCVDVLQGSILVVRSDGVLEVGDQGVGSAGEALGESIRPVAGNVRGSSAVAGR
jgi:hypothetical protein